MAKFDPPGNPMSTIAKMVGKDVLVAYKTKEYASGPSVTIVEGFVSEHRGKIYIKTTINHNVDPVLSFQRWWPLPKIKKY